MAVKTRNKHSKPAATFGHYTVWFAEIDSDGDPSYDIRCDGEHYEAGFELADAKEEAARLDREDRITALREQLTELADGLDDDTDLSVALLSAAITAMTTG